MNFHFSKRASTALLSFLRQFTDAGVLCPVNVCYTVPLAIFLSGNRPVFYDVDEVTGLGTLETIRNKASSGCKVMIYVFQYGNQVDIEEIRKYAMNNDMHLVLDYASCFMSKENIPALNDNEAGLLSFAFTKQLELGYGGVLFMNHARDLDDGRKGMSLGEYQEANAMFEEYVSRNHVIDVDLVRNSKMSGAFLGNLNDDLRSQMQSFFNADPAFSQKIKKHKARIDGIYTKYIRPGKHLAFYPHNPEYPRWRFNVFSDKRDLIISKLMGSRRYPPRGIYVSQWYPPINERFGDPQDYPGARKHAEGILNLFNDKKISVLGAYKISMIINWVCADAR